VPSCATPKQGELPTGERDAPPMLAYEDDDIPF